MTHKRDGSGVISMRRQCYTVPTGFRFETHNVTNSTRTHTACEETDILIIYFTYLFKFLALI